ncbi:gamma-glutamyl-gamma-aminobutyrate hydrolase family protein [Nonomuraea sp. NPDC005650]|uniref:gamma-glutamyl-gamma-aminobutyrate hydrolase family protein n=1 Tax=Nonomuraea sp. NPDC005650 TaxID=3157045 RepID=UPI0033B321B0
MTIVVRLEEVTPLRPVAHDPVAHIAVVVSLNFPDLDEQMAGLVRRFTRVALETLVELGASYELVDTSMPLADPTLPARCDGLLLLGGGDIDGSCYGSALSEAPRSYGVDLRADRDALTAIAAAEEAARPILGICRGSQLLNVHRGGTIIPDIEDFALHRGGDVGPLFVDERIHIQSGTRLQALLGAESIVGRSGHHQAVDALGAGLVVAARADDGIIEGLEDPDRWLIGVQWHPEDDDGPMQDRRRLFGGFVEACALSRRARTADGLVPNPAV